MRIFIILIILAVPTAAQRIEEGWKGLLPFNATRQQVEAVLGKPMIDEDGFHRFKEPNDNLVITNYSVCPCSKASYGRGNYDVPEWTILSYTVSMKEGVRFSDLNLDVKNYTRDSSGDVTMAATYSHVEGGVETEVVRSKGIEHVLTIRYRRTPVDTEKFKCK